MAWCMNVASPLIMHWGSHSFAHSHQYDVLATKYNSIKLWVETPYVFHNNFLVSEPMWHVAYYFTGYYPAFMHFWLPAWWALWLLWWPLTDAAMFQCVYGYLQSVFFFLVLFHCCILLEIKLTTTTIYDIIMTITMITMCITNNPIYGKLRTFRIDKQDIKLALIEAHVG